MNGWMAENNGWMKELDAVGVAPYRMADMLIKISVGIITAPVCTVW